MIVEQANWWEKERMSGNRRGYFWIGCLSGGGDQMTSGCPIGRGGSEVTSSVGGLESGMIFLMKFDCEFQNVLQNLQKLCWKITTQVLNRDVLEKMWSRNMQLLHSCHCQLFPFGYIYHVYLKIALTRICYNLQQL